MATGPTGIIATMIREHLAVGNSVSGRDEKLAAGLIYARAVDNPLSAPPTVASALAAEELICLSLPDKQTFRAADGAFLHRDRASDPPPPGYLALAPGLAAEVVRERPT